MVNKFTKNDQKLLILLGVTVIVMVFGFLFLVNAMGVASFYPHYAAIDNALAKYIVVILTMALGIMGFSNVALRLSHKKLRNGLTIGITTFAFVMTLPLTYVFFSLMAFAANYSVADVISSCGGAAVSTAGLSPQLVELSADVLGLNVVDKIMGVNNIYLGFASWFGEGAGLWVVLSFMMILGVVFLLEPLVAGICVVKGKLLVLFGKNDEGKFKVACIATLPILKENACCCGECHCKSEQDDNDCDCGEHCDCESHCKDNEQAAADAE